MMVMKKVSKKFQKVSKSFKKFQKVSKKFQIFSKKIQEKYFLSSLIITKLSKFKKEKNPKKVTPKSPFLYPKVTI